MPRPKKSPRVRLNLEMSEQMRKDLEFLKTATQSDSLAETLRRAMYLYKYLHHEFELGSKLIVRDKSGEEIRVIVL